MKRPRTRTPKRPHTASAKVTRTSKEAAIHLVRLEFDAARLKMGLEQAHDRAATYAEELERNTANRRVLLEILGT